MGILGRGATRAPLTTQDITDGIITSAKVAADVLTAADIAPNAVTASELADDAVDTAAIADGAVDTARLAADAVDGTKIADNAVDSEHIAADSIDAEHYAAGSVDATAIADDAIDSQHYAAASIDNEHLANDAVGTDELANDVAINTSGAITTTGGMTVDGATVFNEASADVDFRVESNGNANMLVVDGGTDQVGIGIVPIRALHIKGSGDPGIRLDSAGKSNDVITLRNTSGRLDIGNNKIQINEAGDVTVSTGDLIFGTAGKGVVLGATTNVDANTLDDYEEGYTTYSSGYTNGGGGTQNFYSNNTAYHTLSWTKIGRQVTIQGMFIMGGYSGADGAIRIGLPFTIGGDHGGISSRACSILHITSGGTTNRNYNIGTRSVNASYAEFQSSQTGADASSLVPSSILGGNGYRIMFSLTYFTDQ